MNESSVKLSLTLNLKTEVDLHTTGEVNWEAWAHIEQVQIWVEDNMPPNLPTSIEVGWS